MGGLCVGSDMFLEGGGELWGVLGMHRGVHAFPRMLGCFGFDLWNLLDFDDGVFSE